MRFSTSFKSRQSTRLVILRADIPKGYSMVQCESCWKFRASSDRQANHGRWGKYVQEMRSPICHITKKTKDIGFHSTNPPSDPSSRRISNPNITQSSASTVNQIPRENTKISIPLDIALRIHPRQNRLQEINLLCIRPITLKLRNPDRQM